MKPHGDPFKHFYSVQILEKHLDTFGHVNHATYFQILEEARWDLVTSRGFGVKEIQTSHQGPVILEAHIEFKREILLRQVTQSQDRQYFSGNILRGEDLR